MAQNGNKRMGMTLLTSIHGMDVYVESPDLKMEDGFYRLEEIEGVDFLKIKGVVLSQEVYDKLLAGCVKPRPQIPFTVKVKF